MEKELKDQHTKSYYEFISNTYLFDNDNYKHYDKVEGLTDAMRDVYKEACNKRHYLLYKCVVNEINKVLRKLGSNR